MLALTHLGRKLDTILEYLEGDDDVDEEETESPDA